jgi:hypothetical protein
MYRELPRYVKQSTLWSCWAAALESWLEVTPYTKSQHYTQDDLLSVYRTYESGMLDYEPPADNPDRCFKAVARDFSMYEQLLDPGSLLTIDMIEEGLNHGHVLLVYNVTPTVSHANVVYGVGYPTGREQLISVMDPGVEELEKQTGYYRNRPLSFYQGKSVVLIAYPK